MATLTTCVLFHIAYFATDRIVSVFNGQTKFKTHYDKLFGTYLFENFFDVVLCSMESHCLKTKRQKCCRLYRFSSTCSVTFQEDGTLSSYLKMR